MKVKKMIKLLKEENQEAELFIWLAGEEGQKIVKIGRGDAIIGRTKSKKNNFVLLPCEIPEKLSPWEDK